MSDLMTVFFEDNAIRTVRVDADIWWMGRDVATCLGYSDAPGAVQDHCINARPLAEIEKSRVGVSPTRSGTKVGETPTFPDDMGGVSPPMGIHPHSKFIPLSDVLRLVVRSKLPSAMVFERWVFEEVLPRILKTGRYAVEAEPDWELMRDKMAMIRETRLTHGRAAAQAMWRELGMPLPPDETSGPQGRETDMQRELYGYIADFLEQCCEEAAEARVRTSELHKVYNRWAAAAGAPYATLTAFGLSMRFSPYRRVKTSTTFYSGLRIREDVRRRIGREGD